MSLRCCKAARTGRVCEFGDRLDDHLRDRLVCGVRDDRTKRNLFTESNLTYQKAWKSARSMETAGKNVAAVQELVKEDETHQESAHQLKKSAKDRVVAP